MSHRKSFAEDDDVPVLCAVLVVGLIAASAVHVVIETVVGPKGHSRSCSNAQCGLGTACCVRCIDCFRSIEWACGQNAKRTSPTVGQATISSNTLALKRMSVKPATADQYGMSAPSACCRDRNADEAGRPDGPQVRARTENATPRCLGLDRFGTPNPLGKFRSGRN